METTNSHPRRNFAILAAVIAVAGSCAMVAPLCAQTMTSVRIATGLNRPVFVTAPPGDTDRIFIVEQRGSGGVSHRGAIRILDLTTGTLLPTPFLNIEGLATFSEAGLLGLAFDPDYATNGRFFVYYTKPDPHTTFISRFNVSATDPNIADPASEEIVLTIEQPAGNHNGGWIGFGPDGYLYIASGDGGSAGDPWNNSQTLTTLLGKMLRIDVSGSTYSIPLTNPFATGGGDPEIWAYGLRNPWRSSFDRETGDLWIADVGQNRWEEVNFQPAATTPPFEALNYGWRCYEGNEPFQTTGCPPAATMTFPVHVYGISGVNRCAVTGGYVYRGCDMPTMRGNYFFGDYCSANIWSFRYENGQVVDFTDRTSELTPAAPTPAISWISSFGEDGRGELYATALNSGAVYKIIPRCYANCTGATSAPHLSIDDFLCFINAFSQEDCYADCDGNGEFNIDDFLCFINEFAQGCP